MPLDSGVRLGPYRIEAPIGAGGMGEVYRARDTRLDRTVAIKLLAADLASDPQFRDRFDREARTISSLDHPHICTLFDIGRDEASGVDYLVMQHLEGETLADRLAVGVPIPVDQALRYAIQVAAALEAAHRAGVVHRDLKPGNVMLTKSGVKLLDFGVAKRIGPLPAGADGVTIAAAPSKPITEKGMLVGTVHYMSPEQLEGRDADARSDIYSFGAVLYEMITGRRAFDGTSALETGLPSAAQRNLDRLLRKCLARTSDDRWQSAADLADELRWIDEERLRGEQAADVGVRRRSLAREWIWIGVATAAALAAIALLAREFRRPETPPPTIAFEVNPPAKERFDGGAGLLALSPDGRRLAFVATGDKEGLYIRSLDSTEAVALDGTENATQPSWSPDGRFLLFNAGGPSGTLKKIDVTNGHMTKVADHTSGRATWGSAGVIIFRSRGSLSRVDANGANEAPVTDLDESQNEVRHEWPVFLPDGRRFLYLAQTADASKSGLYLASIDSKARTRLMDLQSNVDYSNGYLLYALDNTLMARPFDEKTGTLHQTPVAIADDVTNNSINGRTAFSASPNGVLVYRTGSNISALVLTWFDRAGKALGTIGQPAAYSTPRLSPDGHRLVITRSAKTHHGELLMFDLDRGIPTPFAAGPADRTAPIWSPDGGRVFFASNRGGVNDLYVQGAADDGPAQLLYASPEDKIPTGVSPDGRLLLFDRRMPGNGSDVWALPLAGDRTPFSVVATPSNEGSGVFSPDGRWIAYEANDGGASQIFVQPFPGAGARVQLSTANGTLPTWTEGGRIVVYAAGRRLMAVDLTITGAGLKPKLPRVLPIPFFGGPYQRLFAVTPAGDRYLVASIPATDVEPPLTVVVNWQNALKK